MLLCYCYSVIVLSLAAMAAERWWLFHTRRIRWRSITLWMRRFPLRLHTASDWWQTQAPFFGLWIEYENASLPGFRILTDSWKLSKNILSFSQIKHFQLKKKEKVMKLNWKAKSKQICEKYHANLQIWRNKNHWTGSSNVMKFVQQCLEIPGPDFRFFNMKACFY